MVHIGRKVRAIKYKLRDKVVCPIHRFGIVSRYIKWDDTYIVIYGNSRVRYKSSEVKNNLVD